MRTVYIIILAILIFIIISNMMRIPIKNNNVEKFNKSKYKLSIMGIFKNEHTYMEEWLIHHINQGIEHFYLYSNDDKLQNYLFLQKYKEYITLIPWVNIKNDKFGTIQKKAYQHCVSNYNNEYDFIMMLDMDEFLITTTAKGNVIDFMNTLNIEKTKALKVMRFNFGSNGHLKKPNGNVMDNYDKHEKICSSYKAIANSKFINTKTKFYGVHDFPYLKKDGRIYNPYFKYSNWSFKTGCIKDMKNEIPLVINHYYTKSYDEFLNRCKLWKNGGVNPFGYRKNCKKRFRKEDINEVNGYKY